MQLKGAKYFSKIDVTLGFHHIKLDEKSQLLTTIITPFGRFKYKRLPFGITIAPEYFVTKFSKILTGIKNDVYNIDDVLVLRKTIKEHYKTLRLVLKKLEAKGIAINNNKCAFGTKEEKYLGHVLTERGISVDPDRIKSIVDFPEPPNKTELQRFLGIINFTARFIKNRFHILEPI